MLVGDMQFAPLGLVLLACLGEVCDVVGIVVELGKDSAKEGMGVERDRGGKVLSVGDVREVDLGATCYVEEAVDVGVHVERAGNEECDIVEDEEIYASSTSGKQKAEFTHEEEQGRKRRLPKASKKNISTVKSRKRKKPANAIDELFSGLA